MTAKKINYFEEQACEVAWCLVKIRNRNITNILFPNKLQFDDDYTCVQLTSLLDKHV